MGKVLTEMVMLLSHRWGRCLFLAPSAARSDLSASSPGMPSYDKQSQLRRQLCIPELSAWCATCFQS
eukprot:1185928-Prorocentrum_minimum.AAC.3